MARNTATDRWRGLPVVSRHAGVGRVSAHGRRRRAELPSGRTVPGGHLRRACGVVAVSLAYEFNGFRPEGTVGTHPYPLPLEP